MQAWNIVTRGMLQKPVVGALTNNLVIMLESKGEIQAAGLKAIVNAPIGQQAIDLVRFFSPAHVTRYYLQVSDRNGDDGITIYLRVAVRMFDSRHF